MRRGEARQGKLPPQQIILYAQDVTYGVYIFSMVLCFNTLDRYNEVEIKIVRPFWNERHEKKDKMRCGSGNFSFCRV